MVSCGETYVSPEEWVCNAGIVHTRAIVYLIVVKKSTTEIRNLIWIIFSMINNYVTITSFI